MLVHEHAAGRRLGLGGAVLSAGRGGFRRWHDEVVMAGRRRGRATLLKPPRTLNFLHFTANGLFCVEMHLFGHKMSMFASERLHFLVNCFSSGLECFISCAKCFLSRMKVFLSLAKGLLSSMKSFLSLTKGLISNAKCFLSLAKGLLSGVKCFLSLAKGLLSGVKVFLSSAKGFISGVKGFLSAVE